MDDYEIFMQSLVVETNEYDATGSKCRGRGFLADPFDVFGGNSGTILHRSKRKVLGLLPGCVRRIMLLGLDESLLLLR